MDLGLEGWRVLVTGATNGIGAAIAAELVAEGAEVVGTGRPPVEDRQVEGARATLAVELRDEDGPERMIAEAIDVLGGLDGLVLNAGGATKARFDESTDEVIETSFELNVLSSVRAMRSALPALRQAPGRILLVTALSAKEPREGQLPSNIAKAGLAALAKTTSREFGPDGILVNALAPGRIRSVQVDRIWDADARAAFSEQHIPLGRFGEPRELAAHAALLVAPRNTYLTGETIHVDGGMSLATF